MPLAADDAVRKIPLKHPPFQLFLNRKALVSPYNGTNHRNRGMPASIIKLHFVWLRNRWGSVAGEEQLREE